MKRCIAVLLTLSLLLLTACGGGQAPASEPESSPASVSEPTAEPSSSEPEPEPDPMPDLKPGRVLSFRDVQGLTPSHPVKTVKGTQAELDRWKAAVRDPAIARMDFTDMRQESAELPVEQEQAILTAMRDAEIRLYEGNPDPSTGGGCSVTVYDGEETVLFDMSYVGDYFSVWFAGEEVVYYFDGEGTTLDVLLRSEYGKPAAVSAPEPDPAEDPDTGPWDNVDTSGMYDADEMEAFHRMMAFSGEITNAFSQELPKESYSYYTCYTDNGELVLELGVIEESAVDGYLAAWTGTKWDKLVKKPGRVSQARQEEFAEKAQMLDFAPGVSVCAIRAGNGSWESEKNKIEVTLYIDLPPEERGPWHDIPHVITELARQMAIPEDMLNYGIMPIWDKRSGASPDGTVTNPDT